ncbi:MAG: cytochrome c, partial [Zetaproteobacteria bacterium]
MNKSLFTVTAVAFCLMGTQAAFAHDDIDAEKIYKKSCKMCHRIDRKKVGPAFSKMNKDPKVLEQAITNGRGMMPAFGKKLSSEEITAMVEFIRSKQKHA